MHFVLGTDQMNESINKPNRCIKIQFEIVTSMDNSNMDGLIIIDRTQPGTMDSNEIIKMHSMELN